jgi:hypothetical protein
MRTPFLIGLLLILPALWCASCAPGDADRPAVESRVVEATPPPVHATPIAPANPDRLRERLDLAIDQVRRRDLLTTNGFWTVFHGILGLGPSVTLLNPETKQRVNAVDYICNGGAVRSMRFLPTEDGLDVETGERFVSQGHQDQFVAEMAQWNMAPDRRFHVLGKDYTFMDFIRHSKMRARVTAEQELSWTILILAQYLGTDIEWTNRAGEKLHFEDLIRYELKQSMDTAACGGTHRLFGLNWAYNLHLRKGGKTEGVWAEVAAMLARHKELARGYQNADGSFSTSFFRERGNVPDMQLRINTTGHTLEWLALALTDAELHQPWVENAVNALAVMFLDIQNKPMEGGSLYHATHGLLLYYARVYGPDNLGPNAPFLILPPK